jgi:non-ribosomal peptide synthetase component E (peptide arylation enzyme)
MKYTIPFSFKTNCTIEVDASSLDAAIAKVTQMAEIKDGYSRLLHGMSPVINNKIDLDSVEIDEDEAEELNPKQTYEVTIRRTQTMTVYVEAHTEDEACDTANGQYDDGEYDESEFEDEEVEAIDATLQD